MHLGGSQMFAVNDTFDLCLDVRRKRDGCPKDIENLVGIFAVSTMGALRLLTSSDLCFLESNLLGLFPNTKR